MKEIIETSDALEFVWRAGGLLVIRDRAGSITPSYPNKRQPYPWAWETKLPELEDTSVFIIPRGFVKNGLDRYVVLNCIARSVIESCRGEHPEFVFTRDWKPVAGDQQFRMEGGAPPSSEALRGQFNRPSPAGFRSIRVHDLKHTYGHRLRAAEVGFENRKLLLGHKSNQVTTHCPGTRAERPDLGIRNGLRPGVSQSAAVAIRQSDRQECQVIDFMVEREGLEPSTPAL